MTAYPYTYRSEVTIATAAVAASRPSAAFSYTFRTPAVTGTVPHASATPIAEMICLITAGEHWPFDSDEFWDHFEDRNACTDCEHFATRYELEQHDCPEDSGTDDDEDEAHGTPGSGDDECDGEDSADNEGCLKCNHNFSTYSAMILHLESGSYSDVDEVRLNMLAARCRKSFQFVLDINWYEVKNGYDMDGYELYFCPTCKCPLFKLSGPFQHVESRACEEELDAGVIGTLQRYLHRYLD
ncbi:hypothetical protein E8E11_001301 [Didymella keratinophila]|nr:hypothetical protein E8E11_001301 [Didymella keratinophila]